MLGNQRDLNINLEFYTLAARDLSFRDISDRWMSATQKVMGRFFDSETTVLLDAMIEGLTLHRALAGNRATPSPSATVSGASSTTGADGNGSAPKCATH